jgi:hypothetical protein
MHHTFPHDIQNFLLLKVSEWRQLHKLVYNLAEMPAGRAPQVPLVNIHIYNQTDGLELRNTGGGTPAIV